MDKAARIEGLLKLFDDLSQAMAKYSFGPWRELDIPLAQLKSLFIISIKGSTNTRNLANDLGVTPGNVTGIVDRLVEQGLVSRTQNPEDRRVVFLQLTEKGRETITSIRESGMRQMTGILAYMSLDGLSCLAAGMKDLIESVEKHQKDNPDLLPSGS